MEEDTIPFPASLSYADAANERGEVNINFKIPLELKLAAKKFCSEKNILFKDFAAYALKSAIAKHANPRGPNGSN